MTSVLFSPITFRDLAIANRVVVAPMCQYRAADGCMTDWHLMHLGQFALSGAGLLMTEMTDVEPEGRIGPHCVGLYSDASEAAMRRVIDFCRANGEAALGVQIAHAGRKGSITPPWDGRRRLSPEEGGWTTLAPSAVEVSPGQAAPRALTLQELKALKDRFVDSVHRADRIGLDLVELHAAHGYLMHQFLSPVTNSRTDEYGGSREARMRYPLEVFEAMRQAWPAGKPMSVKLSVRDWVDGGWALDDSIAFCSRLLDLGCDYVVASSGGIVWNEKMPAEPGFQVGFAEEIRRRTGMPTVAVGMITEPQQAEDIVASGSADMVALARRMLWNPRWPWHAAEALGADLELPDQYVRGRPALSHDTFATGTGGQKGHRVARA